MSMVRLPRELDKLAAADAPGKPSGSAGLRSTLRERYGIEAAVGSFKDAHGDPNGCVTRRRASLPGRGSGTRDGGLLREFPGSGITAHHGPYISQVHPTEPRDLQHRLRLRATARRRE